MFGPSFIDQLLPAGMAYVVRRALQGVGAKSHALHRQAFNLLGTKIHHQVAAGKRTSPAEVVYRCRAAHKVVLGNTYAWQRKAWRVAPDVVRAQTIG